MDNSSRRGWVWRLLRAEGDPLVRIGWAIGVMLALAVVVAAVVTIVGSQVLDIHGTKSEPLSATTLYDLLKIAFAVAAGIGGVIALVTAYRRQRYIEFAQALAQQQHRLASQAEERAARDSQQQRELAAQAEERAARDSQLERELASTRLLNERFATAAGQLGDDKPAVQLAGVYAMAGLADDWPAQRQTCVDVLCAYLRMPYEPDPGDEAPPVQRQAFQALREVRHTVIRVITAHLQPDEQRAATAQDWRGLALDFTGAIFDGGNFRGAQFTGSMVSFRGAQFTGGRVDFSVTEFSGGTVSFGGAEFSGGTVSFGYAEFSGGRVSFDFAKFSRGTVDFECSKFSFSTVRFVRAEFSGGTVSFGKARFSGGEIRYDGAQFSGGEVRFGFAQFLGGTVSFLRAEFSGGTVSFGHVTFSRGDVRFDGAQFSGAAVDFGAVEFTGAHVDFSQAADWEVPPRLPSWETPPLGVTLPPNSRSS